MGSRLKTPAQQDRLHDYIEQAWDATSDAAKAKYARKALMIDPDALDAYLLLSYATTCLPEQSAVLREGVRRGKIIWAEEIKRPSQSHFWLDMDTRPFMRLLHVLSLVLWEEGSYVEAIELARFILKLNPNDNQGVRYALLAWYPLVRDWENYGKLLKKYKGENGADYLYAVCLDGIRQNGDITEALREAIDTNPHVPIFLADSKKEEPIEHDSPLLGYVTMGSEGEAWHYAKANRAAWEMVPGAINQLLASMKKLV